MPENLIPAGYYRAVAVPIDTDDGLSYVQFGESKEKRTPQVCINFEILDGPELGRRIAWLGYFTDKTTERTVQALRYCGFRGDDLAALVTQQIDHEVQIVVQHEEYNGKVRAKVQWVNQAGGGGMRLSETMRKDSLREFAGRMRNSVRQVGEVAGKKAERGTPAPAANGSPPPGAPGEQPPAPGDDEIPF